MLSRAATLPRVCLSCRLALARRHATPRLHNGAAGHNRSRTFASDSNPADKERIEALISGSVSHGSADGIGKGPSGRRRARRSKDDDKPAPWEFPPQEEGNAPGPSSSEIPELPEVVEEENIHDAEGAPNPERQSTGRPRIDRSRAFRHDLLNHQNLGVDALGKPVEALILKNPNRMTRSKKHVPVLEEATAITGTPLRWEDVLPTEQGPEYDFSDEVYRNIDELRPVDTKVLPRRDFDKLLGALVDGFTREQLVGYFNKGNWDKDLQHHQGPSYTWAVKQAPWQAAQPNDWGVLKPKQQHAVLILTAKWGLDVQEQVEGLGRSLLWLKPHVFQLITRSSSAVLETLSAGLLDKASNERISTSHSDCRLGIYARKSTIPLILERINDVVKSIKTKVVPVRHVEEENLAEPVLRELGRITSTTAQYDSGNQEISVSWLAEDSQGHAASLAEGEPSTGTETEDPADIVSRLLPRRQPTAQLNQAQIITSLKSSGPGKGAFVEHHREMRTMSWRDKLRQWARYVSPVATFGHVLHTEHSIKSSRMSKSRRILSPVVPHPAALTSITADADKPVSQSTAIILNFAPELASNQTQGDTLPRIRLTLPVNPDTDLSAFAFPPDSSLEGVVPLQVNDIMLPDENVDVRLVQQQLFPLDTQQESLKAFLAVSDFNLLAGRLRTPSRATFSVPSGWLTNSSGKTDQEQHPASDIPYLFMGLEIHQIVDLEWRGHTLRYNSIEAGQHGGQRQELSLLAGPPAQSTARDPPSEHVKTFLQLAEEVALGKHFSWDEGYMLMQERSDEQFSWDMLDESFDQEELVDEQPIVQDSEEVPGGHETVASSEEQTGSGNSESRTEDQSTVGDIDRNRRGS
ncbi:hypothetical protein ACCO45_010581 [Purpureocillium lilacinum]|uniref:Uncharacterized protein n=1 Tax=Purpureocillium lilacinum TaxID=33203 RepID=A0ACC4DFY9_PURLI